MRFAFNTELGTIGEARKREGGVSLELVGGRRRLLRVLLPLIQSVMAWMAEAMVNIQRLML